MNKLHYAITYFFIGIVVLACLFFSGCNTPEKLQRQSDKHFFKALSHDKPNVHERCSDIAPPIVLTKDSFVYKPGKTIYKQGEPVYIEVDCDSVLSETKKTGSLLKPGKVILPCPPCDSVRVDTAYISSRSVAVNRNKELALEADNKELTIELTKSQKALSIALWFAIVLSLYTIARWILRIWKIKIP